MDWDLGNEPKLKSSKQCLFVNIIAGCQVLKNSTELKNIRILKMRFNNFENNGLAKGEVKYNVPLLFKCVESMLA